MAKEFVAVICDPHLDERKQFAFPPSGISGINMRLRHAANALEAALRQAREMGAKGAIIAGDITHRHGIITPSVGSAVVDAICEYASEDFNITTIDGNHDLDVTGSSGVYPLLRYRKHIYPGSNWLFAFDGMDIRCFGYGEEFYSASNMSAVICHHHFYGAKVSAHEFVPPSKLLVTDIPEGVKLVVSGHYHKRQELYGGRVVYPGALLQHDFGEAGNPTGFMLLYEDLTYSYVETHDYCTSPKFWIVDAEDPEFLGRCDFDYYRVDYPHNMDVRELDHFKNEAENIIFKMSNRGEVDTRTRVHEVLATDGSKLDEYDVVDAYTRIHEKDTDKARALADMGKEFMRG
jgi:DNA repair exonuclease SbcCD nuclease subunit